MPCRDSRDDIRTEYVYKDRKIHGLDIDDFEAVMCGIMSAKGVSLDKVDWNEVGVPRAKFENWWRHHQEEDRKRRDRELAAANLKATAERALKKLTVEEREALAQRYGRIR